MTQILLNGSPHTVADDSTLATLVRDLTGRAPETGDTGCGDALGIAVAVDDVVVPRTRWAECVLAAEARVEVLTAVQGG